MSWGRYYNYPHLIEKVTEAHAYTDLVTSTASKCRTGIEIDR